MKKPSIKELVTRLLELKDRGESATLLGIGPMSSNLLQASFELGRELDFPLMFIASRNQVDADQLGGGYVNGWDQRRFAQDIAAIAEEIGFDGLYYLCRDHGGPWQRDAERSEHLPEEEAMELARRSFRADIEAGFDLLMIDPTKDPFVIGKIVPLDQVIARTVELIAFCECERIRLGRPEIGYEVGTEETNGGLTSTEKYRAFIERLETELRSRDLPMPTFIVGQTGTLTRKTEQVGHYNFENARSLARMAAEHNVGLKEHNADYLDDVTLLEHIPAEVTASNVAPQYGSEETRAYLKLCIVEGILFEKGLIKQPCDLKEVLLERAIKTERWRKWMIGEQTKLETTDILSNEALSLEILDISGHYVFNDEAVRIEISRLFVNLAAAGIDGHRFVVDHLKRPLRQYAECYRLTGLTSRIRRGL